MALAALKDMERAPADQATRPFRHPSTAVRYPQRPPAMPQNRLHAGHEDTVTIPLVDDVAPGRPQRGRRGTAEPAPVFVDSSGRRQRRVRRFGRLLVVPAVGYVILLVSTLLGGPTVQSPFLPSAQAPHPSVSSPPAAPTTAPPTVEAQASTGPAPARSAAPAGAAVPARAATSPGAATAGASAAPASTAPGTGESVPASAAGHGKPTSAPGRSGKPTAKP